MWAGPAEHTRALLATATNRPDAPVRSADFQVCCIAGFQTRNCANPKRFADLEVGDTADLEVCATMAVSRSIRIGVSSKKTVEFAAQAG
jgi:hypothetical protein